MLSRPDAGWTEFSLNGEKLFSISYTTPDFPWSWLQAAIEGLEKSASIELTGDGETDIMNLTVCQDYCYFYTELERLRSWRAGKLSWEVRTFPVSRLEFCRMLYQDISATIMEWEQWDYSRYVYDKDSEKDLSSLLKRLKELIEAKEEKECGAEK